MAHFRLQIVNTTEPRKQLTNNLHISITRHRGERGRLRADFTPIPPRALLRQLRQLYLTRVRMIVINNDAGPDVVGDRVLTARQVPDGMQDKFKAWSLSTTFL